LWKEVFYDKPTPERQEEVKTAVAVIISNFVIDCDLDMMRGKMTWVFSELSGRYWRFKIDLRVKGVTTVII
jgi:hypothetical protein